MEDHIVARPSTVKRIGGYLHRVVPIADKSGKILSYALKPFMVEFRPRDAFQVIVGAAILAIPVALTEEAWTLGERLPLNNVVSLALLSLLFISTFVYFNFYRFNFSGHGLIDMASYDKFYSGDLHNYDYPEEAIAKSMANLPKL